MRYSMAQALLTRWIGSKGMKRRAAPHPLSPGHIMMPVPGYSTLVYRSLLGSRHHPPPSHGCSPVRSPENYRGRIGQTYDIPRPSGFACASYPTSPLFTPGVRVGCVRGWVLVPCPSPPQTGTLGPRPTTKAGAVTFSFPITFLRSTVRISTDGLPASYGGGPR